MARSVGSRRAAWAIGLALIAGGAEGIELHSVLYQGQRVVIVDRGGLALWQGDILLGGTAELLEATRLADLEGARVLPGEKGAGTGFAASRWPKGSSGLFEIPYVVESDPENRFPAGVDAFNQLLAGFARAVPRTTQADYVAVSFDGADKTGPCFSTVGRAGGRQVLGGASNCSAARLTHELGHAMGLFHEQERSDWPRWVTIDYSSVDPFLAYNYEADTSRIDVGPYDYASNMHYGPQGFSTTGAYILETIPPGIAIGVRGIFSQADLETLRRLYGQFSPTIVVDTHPSGLAVLVDGVSRVTPASFDWPIGSTHTLEVPAGAQVLNGVVHVFGRWSTDARATLGAKQTVVVAPGNGTVAKPSQFPSQNVYVANFVRMKEVRLGTQGNRTGVGGAVSADPAPVPVAGASGNYYRDRQAFTLTPTANAGAAFGRWRGTFSWESDAASLYSAQMRGPFSLSTTLGAYTFNAYFVDFPFVTVRARDASGDVIGVSATLARTTGTTSVPLPYNTSDTTSPWSPGESATVTLPALAQPWAASVRLAFVDLNGSASPVATITHPLSGQASSTLLATYKRQFNPYRLVNPSCGGTMTVNTNSDGWIDKGASLNATVAPNSNWVVARWRGSVSGTGNTRTLVANDVPNLVVDLNTVATPLEVTLLSPSTTPAGRAFTLEIFGTGFTPGSRVFVNGALKAATAISATRIAVPLVASDYPAAGKVVVTVQNRNAAATCSLNVSSTFEVFSPASGLDPNADSDGDGIPNGVEAALGTNPLGRDNDLLAETLLGRQLFVMQQYRDFLGREGDAAGINYWLGEIVAGRQTRASMAESFLISPEYQDRVAPIVRLYFATYLRIPDSAGLEYWIGRFQAGTPLATIAESFAGAPEFIASYGTLGNRDYVTRLYQNILERPPDTAGANFWTGQLDARTSTRGAMLAQFSESAEYRAKAAASVYVTSMYRAFLRRAPDQAGFDYWRQQIANGTSGQSLVNSFIASAEYAGRFLSVR